ncbi:ABC transporter substrate-binding protein [Paracoccus suum]|uniref:ABC transporter substrate-binding protein n=2 Tax=Paracoccus suum TaxID=2259340 RepID=A0A344PNL4_9RHOB|nr:ABC transporter substrate-binding protein [Paracoccus suum]
MAQPAADTIVVGLSADVTTFDPDNIASRDNANIARHIFGTLYTVSAEGKFEPSLAESLEVSEDGKTYTYTMKEGLTCHDGEPLTAEDVAYSFNRGKDPAGNFTGNTPGFIYSSIAFDKAEAVDDRHVKIMLGDKNLIAEGLLAEVYIHCKDSYEKMSPDQAATSPIGSGAYKLASWAKGSEVVLERVDPSAKAARIVWRIIPEASTRTAELIGGNVDLITNVAPDQLDAINASKVAKVQAIQGTRRMYVGFNMGEQFKTQPGGDAIQDPKVRRAMQYAIDVPAICKQLLNFECERATGLVNPPNDNKALKPYPYDPEMAEKLLDEAGWPRKDGGERFSIKLQGPRGRYLNDQNVILAIAQYLGDIGINVEPELMEWSSVYVPLIRERNAGPMFFLGTGGAKWSALYDMSDLSEVDAGTNYTRWSDPRWFDRWEDIKNAATEEDRRKIIDEMLTVFYEDGPWLLLYFQPDFYGVSNRIDFVARPDEEIFLHDVAVK